MITVGLSPAHRAAEPPQRRVRRGYCQLRTSWRRSYRGPPPEGRAERPGLATGAVRTWVVTLTEIVIARQSGSPDPKAFLGLDPKKLSELSANQRLRR